MAVDTAFRWTVQGTTSAASSTVAYHTAAGVMRMFVSTDPDADELSRQVKLLWELKHLRLVDNQGITEKDNEVHQDFHENIIHKKGRYKVALPWKENAFDLSDNKDTALHRLRSLTSKLMRSEGLIHSYDQAVRGYLLAGHAEQVNQLGEDPKGPVYDMPHRSVIRPGSETTKQRVVFGASSSGRGQPSLNDLLLAGPNLNQNLWDVLIRFRTHNVALMADVEKTFQQVELVETDRDALRFLCNEGPL